MRISSVFIALAMLVISSAASAGIEAPSSRSFIFDGGGCDQQAVFPCFEGARAELRVLTELVPLDGNPAFISPDTIVDFSFSSDSGVFDGFDFQGAFDASGVLFGDTNELADVFIHGLAFVDSFFDIDVGGIGSELIEFVFQTSSSGTGDWSMTALAGFNDAFADDIGTIGVWNPVPEPGALALFGVGLVGLGLMRRRRKAIA